MECTIKKVEGRITYYYLLRKGTKTPVNDQRYYTLIAAMRAIFDLNLEQTLRPINPLRPR